MSDVIGSAEFELRATRKKMAEDLKGAEADLKGFTDKAEKEVGGSTSKIGGSVQGMARGISTAITAMVAVLAAGIAFAVQAGGASLKMAQDIADSARRIGIGTAALQEFQYVARKTGEDSKAVGSSLEGFATKFAQAAAGISKEDLKSFQAIGFSQDQLRSFKDGDAALDAVIDRIAELKSPDDRVAMAEKLGLGPLATALREGSDEVARLRDEAAALGLVMDSELIQKGADAQDQLDDLSQIIGIQMAEAFISLSDEVLAFTSDIAAAIGKLNDFVERAGFMKRVMGGFGLGDAVGLATPGGVVMGGSRLLQGYLNGPQFVDRDAMSDLAEGTGEYAPPRARRTPRLSGRDALTPPPGRADTSAQRAAEREARRAERVEQEIFRARQRMLGVAEKDVLTAQQRFDLAQDQLKLERDARDAEIASKTERGEIKAAERQTLDAANKLADGLEDRVLTDSAFREVEDERLATERLMAGLASDLLSLQSGAARTAGERRQIELELLEIAQRQRRDALQLELDRDPSKSPSQRADAMAANGRIEQAETSAVNRQTMSPLEQWRDQSLLTANEISEAYESVAARGLDSLNSGIVDAIMNSKTLGETFSNVARQIVADLMSIAVRQGITDPLANALFGGGKSKGGGGGIFASIGNLLGKIPGFASGTDSAPGGLAYVHGGEVLMNLQKGTSVIPKHAVEAMGAMAGSGGGVLQISVDKSKYFDVHVERIAAGPAAAYSGAAYSAARGTIPAETARRDRYRLR